jgi:hypothetical protein
MTEHDAAGGKDGNRPAPTFKVTDRRHFTVEGERRSAEAETEETEQAPSPSPPPQERPPGEFHPDFEHRPLEEPSEVSFTMLINAMAQPALLFLGEIPHPGTGQAAVDPEKAKLQIDMLELLRVKCRGNLSRQEEGLLEQVLYQLRMLYVARIGQDG